jgi:hypothetical protein
VIRYYDWPDETLPGKTLTIGELAQIKQNLLNVAVIFQHHNDKIATFEDPNRGVLDANISLDLARTFSQPANTAIYFGVDGVDSQFLERNRNRDMTDKYGISSIKRYFADVNRVVAGSSYFVGAYGSGLVCRELLDSNLARYCWLANARSWPEYALFEATGRWSLKQSVSTKNCFGEEVDLNVMNGASANFGQWPP